MGLTTLDLAMQLDTLTEAASLADEWWELWHRDPQATPFQSPAWLLPWRRHFEDGENVILTLRQDGRLVGLFPFMRLDGRLLLWGAGTSDWLGGVLDPGLEPGTLADALTEMEAALDLFQLPENSPLLRVPAPGGWEDRLAFSESCALLSLPAELSPNMRQNLRYYGKRAARAGIAGPERASAANVERLAELHTRRWEKREEAGIFADRRILAWLREAAPLMERAGLLRLYAMRLRGDIVAAMCVLHGKGRAFYYIGGFEPEYAKLGLGTVLIGHAVAEAEGENFRSFDFLRGQEDYKYRWGAKDCPTYARRLAPAAKRAA